MKQPLIVLTGPTAVGKTSLSIQLAKAIGGEIISADSMQVYRHMDIGSAKVTADEMEGVPHHLIDVLEPDQDFNVVTFQHMAKEALQGIYNRRRIPIIAGGTGFYIQALLYSRKMRTAVLCGGNWRNWLPGRGKPRLPSCTPCWKKLTLNPLHGFMPIM